MRILEKYLLVKEKITELVVCQIILISNKLPDKMTQYNSLNVKLSHSQLNKLKSAIKNETEVVLRQSSNMIGNSDDETNFRRKLLSTNR